MPIPTTSVIYECRFSHNAIPCDSNRIPFKAIAEKAVEEHEHQHAACIKNAEERRDLRARAEQVLAEEIRVGTWQDWTRIFGLSRKLTALIGRQGLFCAQSLGTYECGLSLTRNIKELIWFNTKEGKTYENGFRWFKIASKVLNACFSFAWYEELDGPEPKKAEEHLPEIWRLVADLETAVQELAEKYSNLEGMDDVLKHLNFFKEDIKRDIESLSKRGVVIVLEECPHAVA